MTCSRLLDLLQKVRLEILSLTFAVAMGALTPGSAIADEPNQGNTISAPAPTTVTSGHVTGSVGPQGLAAGANAQTSTTTPATDPGRTDGGAVDWNLLALFEGGCDGRANTMPFEVAAGIPGGLTCNGAPPGPGSSLEDHARALLKSVPWPNLVVESNPVKAIVAVPTYYWVNSYDGSPRQAHAPVTIQEGEDCTEVLDEDGNPTGGRSCSPHMVTYAMTVTATPQSYTWTWDDVREDRISHRLPPPTSLSLPDLSGLGLAFLPPLYPESQVVHVFQDSSYFREPAGYNVGLTVTYGLTWHATGPGGERGGALGAWNQVLVTRQHVQEIQILRCLPEVRGSCK